MAFTFLSHKLLRWACPFLLVAALAANAALAVVGGPLYLGLLTGQVLFYALAIVGTRLPATPMVCKVVRLTTMFTSMNAALMIGFIRWARGLQRAAWERTARAEKLVTIPLAQPQIDTLSGPDAERHAGDACSHRGPSASVGDRRVVRSVHMSVWPFTIAARRGFGGWLPNYLVTAGRRGTPGPDRPVHLLLCVADHFEPKFGNASPPRQRERVRRWVREYPRHFGSFRDSDGRPPRPALQRPSDLDFDNLAAMFSRSPGQPINSQKNTPAGHGHGLISSDPAPHTIRPTER